MNILLSVDGSKATKRMLAYVATQGEWLGADHRYTVLHVVPFMPARVAALTSDATIQRYYSEEVERVFKPIKGFVKRQGLRADFVGQPGNVAESQNLPTAAASICSLWARMGTGTW